MSVEELLPAYIAGELSEEEREQVRAALVQSPRLRAELERYQQLFLLFTAATLHEMEMPADLQTRLARQLTLHYYLKVLTAITTDLFGLYGRALAYYFRLL